MKDRAGRAERRVAQVENRAEVVLDIVSNVESDSGSSDGDFVEEVVGVPRGRAQPPRAIPPLAMGLSRHVDKHDKC